MKTDNELIAEFMEVPNVFVDKTFGAYQAEDETGYIDWVDNGIRTLNYHQDWRLLMPVVEKIEHEGFHVLIEDNFCRIGNDLDIRTWTVNKKIEAVYTAVVQFVKWYNSQSSKPEK